MGSSPFNIETGTAGGTVPRRHGAPDPTYLDLIVDSLRDACQTQGEAAYPLIARMIDQHLAGSLQRPRIGRWRNEALDGLLTLISPRIQSRVCARPHPPLPGHRDSATPG